jgi:two-component system sensor histidine kinase KdpD
VGVLSVRPRNRGSLLAPEQRLLLDSFAHQIGLSLEVSRLEESARRSEVEAEAERMRSSLLSSVSHDFRTPLAAVLGSAEALLKKKSVREDPASQELLENIRSEAERLSRLVRNLLEATRLESGNVSLRKEPVLLEDIVGSALERVEKSLGSRRVDVSIPEDLPAVPADEALLEQVLVNLLENAARHTPTSASVEVSARVEGGAVLVAVADRGPGLKEEDLPRVFEKFHRDASSPGAGLGLAICRAVVKVHGGDIRAGNRPGGGAIFSFTLPLEGKDG